MKFAPLKLIETIAGVAVVAAWALVSASADDVNRRQDQPAPAATAVAAATAPQTR